jgi:hypothetical protein
VKPGVTQAESSSVGWGGYPNKTVDGDKRQSPYTYCMHTAAGQEEAWLRVDLGEVYNLKSVKLWYRNDRKLSVSIIPHTCIWNRDREVDVPITEFFI